MKNHLSARLCACLTAALLTALPAQAAEMIVASWLSPQHPMNSEILPTWGKWISEATDGRVQLKIEYYTGHPKDIFNDVEDGAYDAGWSYHGYIPGRFKLTQMAELPHLNASPEAASVAYWRMHEKYLAAANEHDGLEVVGLFAHGAGHIMMREPISGLADMKGKKIRVGGGIQKKIADRLGVIAVPAPAAKIYEYLTTGVADGVFIPAGELKTMRLTEVVDFVYRQPGMYLGSLGLFINPSFLSRLSPADRTAILSVSGERISKLAGRALDKNDADGLAAARAAGDTIVEASAEEQALFEELTRGMDEEWLQEVSERGVEANAALNEFRQIARQY